MSVEISRFGGLSEGDFREVVDALRTWASTHPLKDDPVIMLMGRTFRPRQFVAEVAEQTYFGLSFLDYLRRQSREAGIRPRSFIDRAIHANRPT